MPGPYVNKIHWLILGHVLKGQGSVGTFSGNRSSGRYHFKNSPYTYQAHCWWVSFLTLPISSTTCSALVWPWRPILEDTPSKQLLLHHTTLTGKQPQLRLAPPQMAPAPPHMEDGFSLGWYNPKQLLSWSWEEMGWAPPAPCNSCSKASLPAALRASSDTGHLQLTAQPQ